MAGDGRHDDGTAPLPPYPSTVGHPWTHSFRSMRDVFDFRARALANHDVVRVRLFGPGDVYHLGHPDYFERVLVSDRERFRKSDDFPLAFGSGLVAVEGEEWRRQRELLQPLFRRERLRGHADTIVEQVRRRRRRWSAGDRIDLARETSQLSLDVLFATLFGRELALDGDEDVREAAGRLGDWFAPTSYPLPNWVPTPARRRFAAGKRRLQDAADRLLEEKARDPPSTPADADDVLSLLVALRESGARESDALDDDTLRDQVVTMIFAGHDTTATAIAFAFYALSRHPDVRQRFHAEVDRLDGPPTVEDLDALAVTDRVVTETLRLYPPVYTIPREAAGDVTLGGYRVPAGSRLFLAVERVQRDPRFFDDPESFRPERWTDDLRRSLPDFAYAPFGGGPRRCIGRSLARIEAKLALATVAREYELRYEGGDDPPLDPEMTLGMEPETTFSVVAR